MCQKSKVGALLLICAALSSLAALACRRDHRLRPLSNDAYVWQRHWDDALLAALRESASSIRTWRVPAAEGFERAPNYAVWGSEFDGSRFFRPTHQDPDLYQTEDERKRVAASAPRNDVRFQYRLTAVEHATLAANLLPRSSQAFASVLCQATQWVIDREPQHAEAIYQRYLHQGAYVPWGRSFGRSCPDPDFAKASRRHIASSLAKHFFVHARVHPLIAGLSTLVTAALVWALIHYIRDRRKSVTSIV